MKRCGNKTFAGRFNRKLRRKLLQHFRFSFVDQRERLLRTFCCEKILPQFCIAEQTADSRKHGEMLSNAGRDEQKEKAAEAGRHLY